MADLLSRIQYLLMADWDPIGVRDTDCPRDEYHDYAYQVWDRLMHGGSAEEVSVYLSKEVSEHIQLKPDLERTRLVAEKLAALRDRVISGWKEMSANDSDAMWKKVKETLVFRPSMDRAEWPGIAEPKGSVTFKLTGPDVAAVDDLNERALASFRSPCPKGERIAALEWEGSCYWLDPHRDMETWEIDVYPNGDYYMFLDKDLKWGLFGHPWEGTLCMWGGALPAVFSSSGALALGEVARKKPS